jgi:hypothetical protein
VNFILVFFRKLVRGTFSLDSVPRIRLLRKTKTSIVPIPRYNWPGACTTLEGPLVPIPPHSGKGKHLRKSILHSWPLSGIQAEVVGPAPSDTRATMHSSTRTEITGMIAALYNVGDRDQIS